ncbi:uncharacterized protein LOC133179432 [Saccostrea echinata]|uniref:uncharacterized protein LOC133179432 n=1 Tax=Saccostrea echinata TaxID=191078 RepID=UPI002A7FE58B|nr:uncharacterized protein LOC133179432 [Saccostrea echinata]
MSPCKPGSPKVNMEGVEDKHSAFVNNSKNLIESTKEKLNQMQGISHELRNITSQITDDQNESNRGYIATEKEEKKQGKSNTQIKVVVPICTDVTETSHKSHPKRKHHKKSTPRGKKAADDSLSALTKKYGRHKTGKTAVLDPIKYLQELEEQEKESKNQKTPVRKKSLPPPPQDREVENSCKEVTVPKNKTRHEHKESTSMSLPKIGHIRSNDNEMCSLNLPGRKIACENCKAKAMKDLDFTNHIRDSISSVSRDQVHTSRTVHRHCCAKSSKPAIYYHCSNESTGKTLPAYIAQTFLHNRRILTCNARTMKSDQTYQKPISNLGFHPERYSCPKSAACCCINDYKQKESECFSHREILRPNKVTLQSPGLPALMAGDYLPLEEISIGFRFRIGNKEMYRIPIAFEPAETGRVHHYESPKRIVPRAKTFYGHYKA